MRLMLTVRVDAKQSGKRASLTLLDADLVPDDHGETLHPLPDAEVQDDLVGQTVLLLTEPLLVRLP